MFELNIPDLDRLMKDLRELTPKLQKRALTNALRKGARYVTKSAKARVPVDTGELRSAIVTRVNTRMGRRVGGAVVQVGILGGARQYADTQKNRARVINRGKRKGIFIPSRVGQEYEHGENQFYIRFLEFGTSKMAARPFLQPALKENINVVTQTAAAELRKAIDRIVRTGK